MQTAIQNPCETINIEISPITCTIQDSEGTTKKVPGFSGFQSINFIQTLFKKINKIRDGNLNFSSIKISLEEIMRAKKCKSVEKPAASKCIKISQKLYLEKLKKLIPSDNERIIGLDRLENNCCINATLQIILNNPELREVWEECFTETAIMYYTAVYKGQSSALSAVGNEFRKQLVQKSFSNLIDQSLFTQEDPTAFLEVFFNICKKRLDLFHMEIIFQRMKYKQIVSSQKPEPTIKQPENHQ